MSIKERADDLKKQTAAVYLAMRNRKTPVAAKIVAGMTVAYALSPLDLIPDFIPIFGQLDDLIVIPLLITLTIKLIPKPVMEECHEAAEGMWGNGKPVNRKFAIPIIIIWAAVLCLVTAAIIRAIMGSGG